MHHKQEKTLDNNSDIALLLWKNNFRSGKQVKAFHHLFMRNILTSCLKEYMTSSEYSCLENTLTATSCKTKTSLYKSKPAVVPLLKSNQLSRIQMTYIEREKWHVKHYLNDGLKYFKVLNNK